jgi:hypothetical protein
LTRIQEIENYTKLSGLVADGYGKEYGIENQNSCTLINLDDIRIAQKYRKHKFEDRGPCFRWGHGAVNIVLLKSSKDRTCDEEKGASGNQV